MNLAVRWVSARRLDLYDPIMPISRIISSRLSQVCCAALLLVASSHAALASSEACSTTPEDKAKVVDTLRQMFAAIGTADGTAVQRVLTGDFYAFDAAKRVDTSGLLMFAKAAAAAGKHYTWTVNEPDVHLTCNGAWIAYTNRGSVQDAAGTTNLTWLESAVLVKDAGAWKIAFLHSTRVP